MVFTSWNSILLSFETLLLLNFYSSVFTTWSAYRLKPLNIYYSNPNNKCIFLLSFLVCIIIFYYTDNEVLFLKPLITVYIAKK